MTSSDRQKIIIDTDCGIDDAIALLLALSSKDVADILAITCCWGNTCLDNVCSNVKRVLTVCEENSIPIFSGCSGPLLKRLRPGYEEGAVHGNDGLGNCASQFSTGNLKENDVPASVALIDFAKKYPQQITVIAIGPLTNLAIAHRIDPAFTDNLKSIVIMGGNYKGIGNVTEVAEFNFYADPEAADIVVSEADCTVVLIPWETTMNYGIPWDFYYELLTIKTPKADFFKHITEMRSKSIRRKHQFFDCDFLAVVAFLYPNAVQNSFKSQLRVEYKGKYTKGLTILKRESPSTANRKKIKVITDYDREVLNSLRRQMLS